MLRRQNDQLIFSPEGRFSPGPETWPILPTRCIPLISLGLVFGHALASWWFDRSSKGPLGSTFSAAVRHIENQRTLGRVQNGWRSSGGQGCSRLSTGMLRPFRRIRHDAERPGPAGGGWRRGGGAAGRRRANGRAHPDCRAISGRHGRLIVIGDRESRGPPEQSRDRRVGPNLAAPPHGVETPRWVNARAQARGHVACHGGAGASGPVAGRHPLSPSRRAPRALAATSTTRVRSLISSLTVRAMAA